MPRNVVSNLLGLLGAIVGGGVGYAAFWYAWSKGLYAMILPGGLLGLGCGLLALHNSKARGIACLVAGLVLGLFTEWRVSVWKDDLGKFLSHIPSFDLITLLMIGVGGLLAFWCGKDHFGVLEQVLRKPPKTDG